VVVVFHWWQRKRGGCSRDWTGLQPLDSTAEVVVYFDGLTHLGGCGIAGKEGNLCQHCWAHPTNKRLGSLARDVRI